MFSVYGESQLDSINTSAAPATVAAWKASAKTKACYRKLFTLINNDDINSDTYITRILAKVQPGASPTNMRLAYMITVCQIMLSDHYEKLIISEEIVKNRLRKNLVNNI